jgi:succinate dehydrogenase / fumarate reductase, membrane anchor subunit
MASGLEERVRQPPRVQRGRGGTTAWILQVVSGVLLIFLLGAHIVAQHFVVKGGLRDYAQVVSYLSNPAVLAIESLFVVVLIWHAMLGLRAVLLDFGPGRRGQALITRGVVVLGALTAGYSFWLIATIAAKS